MDNTTSEQDFESLIFEAAPVEAATTEEAPSVEETPDVETPVAEAAEETQETPVEVEDDDTDEVEAEPVEASEAAETEDTVETPEEPLYSVKVDGEMQDVTLDELLRGYSGQEYVQKGMKEAAQFKKDAENAYEVLQGEIEAMRQLRQRMERGDSIAAPEAPNPADFANDPIGYSEAKMEYDGKLAKYQEDTNRMQKVEQADQYRKQKMLAAEREKQMAILHRRLPDLADPQKAPALQKRIVNAGMNYYGFSEQEMGSELDARRLSALHDAMRWREAQAAGKQVKPQKSKPAIKPGAARTEVTSKSKQRAKVKARMQKSGDMNSVMDFLMS